MPDCSGRRGGQAFRASPPMLTARFAPAPHGPVAQRLEPAAHNGLVVGSNPTGPTSISLTAWMGVTPPREAVSKPE